MTNLHQSTILVKFILSTRTLTRHYHITSRPCLPLPPLPKASARTPARTLAVLLKKANRRNLQIPDCRKEPGSKETRDHRRVRSSNLTPNLPKVPYQLPHWLCTPGWTDCVPRTSFRVRSISLLETITQVPSLPHTPLTQHSTHNYFHPLITPIHQSSPLPTYSPTNHTMYHVLD
mmetsp:Transcript_10612/g.18001  ORF Transcript_10612/g.18001 Transcript_10612/m.18001 type:complete len:175 (-) Transcript_10612:126-650(-)